MSALSITLWALLEAFISIFIGAYTCRSIPFALTTLRDFGFLTVNVLLPCLALYNVAKAATPVMLLRMLVLICFAVLQIALNYGCGWIVARVLFRTNGNDDGLPAELRKDVRLELLYDHTNNSNSTNTSMNDADAALGERVATPYVALVLHDRLRGLDLTPRELLAAIEVPSAASERLPGYVWGCIIACSVQNTLSLPLALLENLLPMLPWVDFGAGVSYAFLFHVICLIYLSGCAPYLVQRAERACRRRRLIRLILQRTKHLSSCVDATTQTTLQTNSYMRIAGETQHSIECAKEDDTSLSETSADNNNKDSSTKDVDVMRMPHDWPAAGRVRVVFESDFAALRPRATSQWRRLFLRPARRMLRQLATYLPFLAIVLGLVIGIVPFVRGLFFDEGVLEMFTDAISLVAQGGIPSTLLLLGANLGGPATFSTISTTTSQDGAITTTGAAKQQSAEQNVNFSITAEHVYLSSDEDDEDNTTTAEGAANNAGRQGEGNAPVTAVTSGAVNGVHSSPHDNAALASGQRARSVDSSSLSESHTELETELQRNTTTTITITAQRVTQHDEATQSHNPSFFPSTQRPATTLTNNNTRVGRENNSSSDDEEREVPEIDLHASFTLQTLVAERPSGAEAAATTMNSAAASPTAPNTLPLPSQQQRQQQKEKEVTVQQPTGPVLASADTRREGDALQETTSVTNVTAATLTPPPPTTSTTNNAAPRPEGADTTTTTIVPVEVEETIASMATLRAMLSLKHVQPRFVLGVSVGRLLLCPGVTLFILWLCVNAMPWLFGGAGSSMDRTFVLVLILEIMAPTAVNTALLFRSQNFMVREWAEMLFVQNLLALLSIVLWCSVAISLLHTTSNAVPE